MEKPSEQEGVGGARGVARVVCGLVRLGKHDCV